MIGLVKLSRQMLKLIPCGGINPREPAIGLRCLRRDYANGMVIEQ